MKLYSYWRSSASYRVRIALALKGLQPEIVPINLLNSEQKSDEYAKLNPQHKVPALAEDGHLLTQSIAIIEYLEEKYPEPPLLPATLAARAHVRSLSLAIACDISPMNNLGPMHYLTEHFHATSEQKNAWFAHWINAGFAAIEKQLAASPYTGSFCHRSSPSMADCLLIPQVYNARRYHLGLTPYPTIERIEAHCAKHPAFIAAHPDNQPDAH